uniref:(northern house mosquito) hypothetical protein n=1 Tax=Culex pipiens TaxID=7175 RepID=A0A8D8AAI1_CULPI
MFRCAVFPPKNKLTHRWCRFHAPVTSARRDKPAAYATMRNMHTHTDTNDFWGFPDIEYVPNPFAEFERTKTSWSEKFPHRRLLRLRFEKRWVNKLFGLKKTDSDLFVYTLHVRQNPLIKSARGGLLRAFKVFRFDLSHTASVSGGLKVTYVHAEC